MSRVFAILLLSSALHAPAPALAVPSAPEPSFSHYLTFASNADVCDMGDEIGDMQISGDTDDDAFVILHFFSPQRFSNGEFGARAAQDPLSGSRA